MEIVVLRFTRTDGKRINQVCFIDEDGVVDIPQGIFEPIAHWMSSGGIKRKAAS